MKHGAQLDRGGRSGLQRPRQPVDRIAAVYDVLDKHDVPPLDRRRGIVQKLDVTGRRRARAVARCHDEIHMQRSIDVPNQVTQKDERPFQ